MPTTTKPDKQTSPEHDRLDDMSAAERAESDQLLASAADRGSVYRGDSNKGGGKLQLNPMQWSRRNKIIGAAGTGILGITIALFIALLPLKL